MLRRGYTRETRIRRDRRGRWFEGDEPLDSPAVERAFDGWIERAEDGRLCLKNDINWAYVEIEGPPYRVRSVELRPEGVLLHLSGERREPLDPRTLREGPEHALWCQVQGGSLAARFDAHAMNQLADLLGEDDEGVYLAIGGARVRPPLASEPLLWEDAAADE